MNFLISLTQTLPETAGVMFFGVALVAAAVLLRRLVNVGERRREAATVRKTVDR